MDEKKYVIKLIFFSVSSPPGRLDTAFSHLYVKKLRIYKLMRRIFPRKKDTQFCWEWQKNYSNLKRKIQNLGNISKLIHTCDGTQNRDIYIEMLILFLRTCFNSPRYVIFKWNLLNCMVEQRGFFNIKRAHVEFLIESSSYSNVVNIIGYRI